MNPDLSLLERLHHGLCESVERDGSICFGKKKARGYCDKHLARHYKYGTVDLPIIKKSTQCVFIDCKGKPKSKGYCSKHYQAYWKTSLNTKECVIDGCNNKHLSKGYCNKHYKRMRNNWDPLKKGSCFVKGNVAAKKAGTSDKKCIAPGCEVTNANRGNSNPIKKGLCQKHYARWRSHGSYNVVLPPHGKRILNGRHSKQMDRERTQEKDS